MFVDEVSGFDSNHQNEVEPRIKTPEDEPIIETTYTGTNVEQTNSQQPSYYEPNEVLSEEKVEQSELSYKQEEFNTGLCLI